MLSGQALLLSSLPTLISFSISPIEPHADPSSALRGTFVPLTHPTTTANALEANEENGCNGTSAQVWDPLTGEWHSTFQTIDGESHSIDMFYLNLVDGVNELWVTEIESWMAPSLYNQLQYNYVKLSVTCPDDNTVVDSCVTFKPT